MIEVKCNICGKTKQVHPYRLKTTSKFYCSKHQSIGRNKSLALGRIYGPKKNAELARAGKTPRGTLLALQKGWGWMKGKHHSEETKKKLSESLKKRVLSPGARINILKGLEAGRYKGKKHSMETKQKLSVLQKGRKATPRELEMFKRGREYRLGLVKNNQYWTESRLKSFQERSRRSHLGKKMSEVTKAKKRIIMKEMWEQNTTYRKNVLGRRGMSGLEKRVNNVIVKYGLPYKFVGDGQFFIERKNPDFVNTNGKKVLIEVFYKKHKDQFRPYGWEMWAKSRSELFRQYGWETRFIEGSDINNKKIFETLTKGGELLFQ